LLSSGITFNVYSCVQQFKLRRFLKPDLLEAFHLNTGGTDNPTCKYIYFVLNKHFIELTTTTKDKDR
jgi:hypothetical protein